MRLVQRTITSVTSPIYTLSPLYIFLPVRLGLVEFESSTNSVKLGVISRAGNRVYMSQIRIAIELIARCDEAISDDNGSWESFAWAPNFPDWTYSF